MVCLVIIVAAQGPMQNLVLCLGADGHVAVEASVGVDGSCTDSSVSRTPRSASPALLAGHSVRGAHCGTCLDLVLTHTDALYGPSVSSPPHSAARTAAGPPVSLAFHTPGNTQPAHLPEPHAQLATLAIPLHLSSTLLLI